MDVDKDGLVSELDLNEFLYSLLHSNEKPAWSTHIRIDNTDRPTSYNLIERDQSP